ncbi:MAG: C40 family peptidase [Elusimicrobia bacterium]|nr:C40 family peptidase [Elusimicrobiota bacterium]
MRRILACGALSLLLAAGCSSGPAPRVRKALPPVPPLAKAVARTAKTWLPEEEKGRPAPKDCSDYVRKVFLENGMDLPRSAREMALVGDKVGASQDLRMGDLVFFSGEKVARAVGHVGIYVNNGVFIHLPGSGVVVMESFFSDYYRRRYLGGRRVIP